ncbi:MAG: hypothetical protein LUE24_12325 [Lachnospiraceae bacterium]|nr:hypothetical protein [Lachnospiraceae bacterium]
MEEKKEGENVLNIDHEFADQIPPLTEEEYRQLETNILQDGEVINPIIVWNGTIVDGHNRYRILQEHPEVPYKTFEKKFSDRNEVVAWICKNQLGRRNLTPAQKKYLIGKQYGAEKNSHGGERGTKHNGETGEFTASSENQNLRSGKKTCEKIARENHVGKDYVIHAKKYADGVDAAERAVPGIRQEIFSGKICPVESAVKAVAEAPPEEQEERAKKLRDPEVQRRGKPRARPEEGEILKKVAADMEATVPKRKVSETSMLETLRGVVATMIRGADKCFELFPTLLTEQVYRVQVIEIMQEPKNYISNLETGGEHE